MKISPFLTGKRLVCLAFLAIFLLFCIADARFLAASDSTTLTGAPSGGGPLAGYTSKNVSGGSNYQYFPTPGAYSWTIPDDAASKVWVSLAAAGAGGPGNCLSGLTGEIAAYGTGGAAGGLVNKQEIAVTPGSIATIVVGAGGGGGSTNYYCGMDARCNGGTGGNTCFYHSGGSICATGGYSYWYGSGPVYCGGVAHAPGGPTSGAGSAGASGPGGGGAAGWARIEW